MQSSVGIDDEIAMVNMEDFKFTFESYMSADDLRSAGHFRRPSLSSVSLPESLKTVHTENGRTYHSFRAGSYHYPNDEQEIERLDFQYEIIKEALGCSYFAPLSQQNPPQAILDIATGTGQWAMEVADEFPEADVIGTDLSPIQPDCVPPNCKFYLEDSSDEWEYDFEFDYIHTRLTAGCWSSMRTQIIVRAFDHLRPGGWLECQEMSIGFNCDDGTMSSGFKPAVWASEVSAAAEVAKRPLNRVHKLRRWFEQAGFVEVQEVVIKIPMNAWNRRDRHQRHIGALWQRNLETGLSAVSYGLLHRVMGKTKEEIEVSLVNVRRDLKNQKVHAYQPLHVVWGRKPFAGDSR